jgi:DNA polymerase
MPILIRDYETRSTLDLPAVGAWRYSQHTSTNIWCCGYTVDDDPVELWLPGDPIPTAFIEAANNPDWLVCAFNDQFERLLEQHILGPRYGFPLVPIERHRCMQAAALARALPGSLDGAASALKLAVQKDMVGHRTMLQMARPRKPRKGEDPTTVLWFDDPERRQRLYAYCKQDVVTERELHHHIPFLDGAEQALWILDQAINDRGVHIDRPLLDAALRIAEQGRAEIDIELASITAGAIDSVHQVGRLLEWLNAHGAKLKNIGKASLEKELTNGLPDLTRQVIQLRLDGAHAAANKLTSMQAWLNGDSRARGTLKFHGASTGRWSSYGIQLQNLKRPIEDIDKAIDAVASGSLEQLRQHYPRPISVVGDITRGLICAAPGHRLIAADLSGIESRVTAWVSGQQSKLDMWANFDGTGDPKGEPYYLIGKMSGMPEDKARAVGKIADLAFGFQGAVGAWRKLAPDDPAPDERIKQLQYRWHNMHPHTVMFWKAINEKAVKAVRTSGRRVKFQRPEWRHISFESDGSFLFMDLPSGRRLAYPFPSLRTDPERNTVSVVFMDTSLRGWSECRNGAGAYGGTWIENAVQAIARDIIAEAMVRLEAAGYRIVLHVHDEVVAEVPDEFGSAEEFLQIFVTPPAWATGLPLAAKVRNGPRFCKSNAKPIQPDPIEELVEPIVEPPPFDSDDPEPVHTQEEPKPEPEPEQPKAEQPKSDHHGSKFEAEQDTYAEEHTDEPFNDALLRRHYNLVKTFDYVLPDASLLYWQNRYELKPGIPPTKKRPRKRFLPHRPVGGKDVFGAGERGVIYNWPAVIRAGPGSTVLITEGESNADACIAVGLLATTVLSHKWMPECVSALTGYHVIILQDHDTSGIAIAANAYKALSPVAASIRIVTTEHLWKHLSAPRALKPADDVEDWLKQPGADPAKLLDICREIPADGIIPAQPYDFPGEATIKPYDWLYGRFLLRGEVVGSAAMGGTGKSSKSIVEALAMTSGRPLLGEEIPHPLRVILINLEDTRNTMDKRILAVMKHYGLSRADIGDRLIVYAKGELKIKIARQLRSGDVARNEQMIRALTRLAIENRADVISIDSFVRTHRVGENENSAIQEVVECFEDVATEGQCGVSLWHHTRKGGGERASIENARGAIAFVDACRSVRILETMSEKEHGELVSIKPDMRPAGYYFRAFNGKRNFAPPADQSTWFEIKSELLLNGDDIGVVTSWAYPAERTDISPETTEAIFADIEKGMPNGQRYSGNNSAKKRSAWLVVQKHCPRKTDTQCRSIVATWIKSGALYEADYHDRSTGKSVPGFTSASWQPRRMRNDRCPFRRLGTGGRLRL